MEFSGIRKEYMKGQLRECDAPEDPLVLLDEWLREAVAANLPEPTAMVVATVSKEGVPSTRSVLLKGIREGRLLFFTRYDSRKGLQLAANPLVSVSFVWYALERQIHIEGAAVRLSQNDSDIYFNSRPFNSRVGAAVSPQSRVIPGRFALLRAFIEARRFYLSHPLKRPSEWGGYIVTPARIEFWQGRENRLHDRLLYTPDGTDHWNRVRLAP